MTAVKKWIRENLKALGAAVGGALATLLLKLLRGEVPVPQTQEEWITLLGTAVGAGVLAWLPTNKITQKQLDKDPNVVGGVVVPDPPPPPPAPSGTTPWS